VVLALYVSNLKLVSGCFEHGNEHVASVITGSFCNYGEFLDCLSNRECTIVLEFCLFDFLYICLVYWLIACLFSLFVILFVSFVG